MNKQPEVRAQTRKKLTDAFWILAREKKVSQISVGELARIAGYNRSTFYEYFTDMPDLICQEEEKLLEGLKEEMERTASRMELNNVNLDQNSLKLILTIFQQVNEPMYCLLGSNGDPSFSDKAKKLLYPTLAQIFGLGEESEYFDYVTAFIYSALIGYMQHWYERGQSLPEEEFFQLSYEMIIHGLVGVKKIADSSRLDPEDSGLTMPEAQGPL